MKKFVFVTLHGNFGSAQDWFQLEKELTHVIDVNNRNIQTQWINFDLFSAHEESFKKENFDQFQMQKFMNINIENLKSFEDAVHEICDKVLAYKKFLSQHQQIQQTQFVFVGYSLGARIGLHFLKNKADFFDHFYFLSAHPGLIQDIEKQQRFELDQTWAQKLKSQNLQDFMSEWQKQDVFKADQKKEFNFNALSAQKLILAFENLSLAQQEDMRNYIQLKKNKITWVVGEDDTKFLNIALDLQNKKILSKFERILSAGHRLIFNFNQELAQIIFAQL